MSDITEYERRISAALARIGLGIEQIPAFPVAVAAPEPLALAPEMPEEAAPVAHPAGARAAEDAPRAADSDTAAVDAEALQAKALQDSAELIALREALEAERQANAQLSDRVRAIRDKQETMVTLLERRLAATQRDCDRWAREVARMKRANLDLTEANRGLTAAIGQGADTDDGVAAHLINRAMLAELESLRALRSAERAELEEILSGLEPLIVLPAAGETSAGTTADWAQEGTHA
ncbi:hypothetical protein [Phaeovulum sp. W22_SRMD_FR3]|uniref:hypothetical protein n=1 Tax=Phaeovulum sp. W22_SRMD_FR3 TaxID=3240274 RepID=UPI003F9C4764